MDCSRVVLRAALTWLEGALAYDRLASAALARAGIIDRLTDPKEIAAALSYEAVPIMSIDDRWRADLRGSVIRYRWDEDHAEEGLNLFYGVGQVILRDSGNLTPTETQVWGMVAAAALPVDAPELWAGHPHVPRWFVDYRIASRRGNDTGVRAAIAGA